MNADDLSKLRAQINLMEWAAVGNYVVPGLTSSLVGQNGHRHPDHGRVRAFYSERDGREFVSPHSHRFSFAALVLAGQVRNTLYLPVAGDDGALWAVGKLRRLSSDFGDYSFVPGVEPQRFREETRTYRPGEVYRMRASEIHSICFSRGADVLVLEGPEETVDSVVLEPWANDERVPTFKVEPWMFKRG